MVGCSGGSKADNKQDFDEVAEKATVEGLDIDNDGVRDDIQRYIDATYPNSPEKRAALKQIAIAGQQMMVAVHKGNKTAFFEAMQKAVVAGNCIYQKGFSYEDDRKISSSFITRGNV